MNQQETCRCADCAVATTTASINRREEALRLVGGPGNRCLFSRVLGHLKIHLRLRERTMDPRLVPKKVADMLLLCSRSRKESVRHEVDFLLDYYQVRGAPLEGTHVLGLDYYYGPFMEVSNNDSPDS